MSLLVKTNPVNTNSTPQTRRKVWGNDTALPSNQCGHCKEFGHAEIQCWKRNPKLKKVCEHCNIYGHNVSVCRYVVKPSRNRTSQQNNLAAVTNTGPRNALSGRGVGTRLLRIRNVEKISSYNWIYGNEMTILTPGQPPEWTKQHDPIQLETDGSAGLHLETLIPYPMEPAVRTLFHAKPIFRCSDVNIFGCGATLGDLFRHVQRAERHPAFRIRVDLVGDTVFFTRLSASSEEARRDAERYGRGYTISNTTSQANVSNIGSHQRIIGYNLGGLKIFLQFEADAYIEDKLPNRGDGGFTKTLSTHLDFDSTTNIYAPSPKRAPPAETLLIPHSALLRIETRANRGFDGPKVVRKQVPRLWLRQVRALALAWHFEGEFHHENVKEMDVLQSDFAGWEENNQENIRKFVSLLRALIASVRATSSGKLEAFCNEGGDIQMLEIAPDSAAILPKNLEDRWRVGASKATTAMKAQVQPMKTFSGSTVPQRNSLGNSIEEDLIDLSSETASEPRTSGQAVTAPSAYRPPINHLPPRLETTFTIDRTQSTAVAREPAVSSKSASRPAVARPAPITTASRFPISKAPISRALISKAPMSKAPMSKAPMSRAPVLRAPISTITVSTTRAANIKVANNTGLNVTAANTAVANSTAANSTPGNTLSTGSHRDSFPKDSSTLARIKDHPQYAWIATMCLFGTAFTLAICGVFVGGIIVATICAITHAGYMLCTKINSLPPVEAKCPSFESPIDSKLNPPPSAPNAQTGRVPTIPTPVTSDAKMFAGPTPDKPVEKKLVKSELIETRLPETSTVRSSPATDMPVPSKAVFVRYCKNK